MTYQAEPVIIITASHWSPSNYIIWRGLISLTPVNFFSLFQTVLPPSSSLRRRVDSPQRHHPLSRIPRAVHKLSQLCLEDLCSRGSRHPSECCNVRWEVKIYFHVNLLIRSGPLCNNAMKWWRFGQTWRKPRKLTRKQGLSTEVSLSFRFKLWPSPRNTTGIRWISLTGLMAMLQGLVATQVKRTQLDVSCQFPLEFQSDEMSLGPSSRHVVERMTFGMSCWEFCLNK